MKSIKNENHIITASYSGIIMGMIALIVYASYFVYHNFNEALTSSSDLLTLRSMVATESINVKGWDEVKQKIEEKHNSTLADVELVDPFDPLRLK